MGSDPAGSDPLRFCLFLLCVFLLTGASPNTNFSSGRAKKSEPPPPVERAVAEPKPVEPPPVEPEPAPVVEPQPETPVGSDPTGGQTPSGLEVPAVPAPPPETVWLGGKLPEGATAQGTWIWDSARLPAGALSHGHPSGKELQSHGYSPATPLPISANGMIFQDVWLDPADPPQGIALQLKLATGDEVGVYWEGEEEVFKPEDGQELWYYGPLPELGQWTKLEILAEDMGLEDSQVTEVRFVTWDGRVLWNRTVLMQAPPLEEADTLLNHPVDIRPTLGNRSSVNSN